MSNKHESHKQVLRQLLDRFAVRFNYNPSLDEARNSGDGSYKP